MNYRHTAPIARYRTRQPMPYEPYSSMQMKENPIFDGQAVTIGAGVAGGILVASFVLWVTKKLSS